MQIVAIIVFNDTFYFLIWARFFASSRVNGMVSQLNALKGIL